jgi:hypothetical protein
VIVEIRSVPECPNLEPVRRDLLAVLAELGLPPEVSEVVGDYPSPTVLVNGVDVMSGAGHGPAACRLDLPTAERIRAALRQAMATGPAAAAPPAVPTLLVDCCAPPGNAIRADRPHRAALLPDGLRRVHQAILRHVATTATAPGAAELAAIADAFGWNMAAALDHLAGEDLVAVDGAGRLIAAYPFSPTPTPHLVSLGEMDVFAMCAIDALGMPFMLGADAVITSTDPHTGQPVRVHVAGGIVTYQPPHTVVVYAASGSTGRSVDTRCSTINFFTSPATAQEWSIAHPDLAATILDQHQALTLGRSIFEPLLAAPP